MTDSITQEGIVIECPENTTTKDSRSVGIISCKCAPGFKHSIYTDSGCARCIDVNEACFFDSDVIICDLSLKLKNSQKHDGCVCMNG